MNIKDRIGHAVLVLFIGLFFAVVAGGSFFIANDVAQAGLPKSAFFIVVFGVYPWCCFGAHLLMKADFS